MQTSNTEKMVTISRAEYEHLQQENAQLEAKSTKYEHLQQENAQLEAKSTKLEETPARAASRRLVKPTL